MALGAKKGLPVRRESARIQKEQEGEKARRSEEES
jgi:hypothetical protein